MIQNLGLLEMFDVESPDGIVQLITDKQFRNRDNFKKDNLHSLIAPPDLMPGFCFKRKADDYTFNRQESGTLGIYDHELNLVIQIPNEQVEFYQSGGYEYVKIRPHRPYSLFNSDGNSFLDDDAYKEIKPYTMPCGWYHYVLTLTKNNGIQQRLYCSEMFQVKEKEAITDGVNLVVNGDFSSGLIGWTTAGTWSVSGGVAINSANVDGLPLTKSIVVTDSSKYRYKVSFYVNALNISTNGIEVRVFHSSTYSEIQSKRIITTGQHEFYADDVNVFSVYTTGATFSISDIRIEKIIGYQDMVYLQAENLCRNIAALPGENYFDFTLLDAEILQPQYGEELKQDENGNLEKLNSFARAFKIFDLSPLQLPEFMIDFLAMLNTFDFVHLYDGKLLRLFELNTTDDETDAISINNFKLANQWLENDVYGLVNISFEKNLAIKNTCCDEIEICDCDEDFEAVIQVNVEGDGVVNISPVGGPSSIGSTYPDCAIVELWYGVAVGQSDIDCIGIPAYQISYQSSGIIVTGAEFNENGIDFPVEDGKGYCFYVKVTQNGCFYETESNHEAYNCLGDALVFDIDVTTQPDGFNYDVTVMPSSPLPSGITVSLMLYLSPTPVADCDVIAEGDYDQYGPSISSDDFNATGFEFPYDTGFIDTACIFVRLSETPCITAESDSPKHRLAL